MLLMALLACKGRLDGTDEVLDDGTLMARSEHALRGEILLEEVAFASEGLRIEGLLALPPGDGPFPVLVFGHGGSGGLMEDPDRDYEALLEDLASAGYLVIAPSFRGQDGSQGERELCLGEVTDFASAVLLADELPEAGARRAGMGVGLGGCVALRASAVAQLDGVVTLGGATDIKRLIDAYRGSDRADEADALWVDVDAEPEAHSVLNDPLVGPLALLYGMEDTEIPFQQGCSLKDALSETWTVGSYRLDPQGTALAGPTNDCQGAATSGDPLGDPATADGLLMVTYEGVGRDFDSRMWAHAVSLLP